MNNDSIYNFRVKRFSTYDEGDILNDFSQNITIVKDDVEITKEHFNVNKKLSNSNSVVINNNSSNDTINPEDFFKSGLNSIKNIF